MQAENAGFFRRLIARFLDKLLGFILLVALMAPTISFVRGPSTPEDMVVGIIHILTALFIFLLVKLPIVYFYHTTFLSMYGGTIGKLLMGLKVVDRETDQYIDRKTAFFRTFAGYTFSSQILGLGYLRIIKDENKYAWHDDLFNTRVKKVNSGILGYITAVLLLIAVVVIPIVLFM